MDTSFIGTEKNDRWHRPPSRRIACAPDPGPTDRPRRQIWGLARPNQSVGTALRRANATGSVGGGKGAERRAHADCIDALVQFITSVLMRLGTSPTGTTAFTVMLCVSIAVTDLIAALEM